VAIDTELPTTEAPTTGAPPPPTKREQRRAELLDATLELVRRDGPMVSMEQIAVACGVTKPIIYRHFADRDDLVMEMANRFLDAFIAEVSPELFREHAEPIDVLTATMDAYLALIERDTNLYRFVSTHAGADRRDLIVSLVAEQVAIVVERVLRGRDLDPAPARTWAFALVGMVHVTGDWWVTNREMSRRQLIDQLTTLLWVGLDDLGVGRHPPRIHDDVATPPRPARPGKTRP
jgi:AcrR family transcriptional regulator